MGKRAMSGRMTIKRMTAAAVAGLLAVTAAQAAGSSRGHGAGGRFINYDPIVAHYNQSGELFRIEGPCQSACTLFLGIRNVCIKRSAVLRFHAGTNRSGIVNRRDTNHMIAAYNSALRNFIGDGHHMDTREFYAISGKDMIQKFGYRECPKR
jgi:hypothetical protein